MSFDLDKALDLVVNAWDADIKDSLFEFCKIPNQSPLFDPECLTNGLQEKALDVVLKWIDAQEIKGMKYRVLTEKGRTPLLFIDIAPTEEGCTNSILAYSHLDKQPPMLPWSDGLDPYIPVMREEVDKNGRKARKLYGRGTADDSYGVYATLTSIRAVQAQGFPHGRVVGLIEMCEESGSFDLPFYLDLLKDEIGSPDLVICLDSGCGDYERLWMTTSLRGMVAGVLSIQISTGGVHSGMGSGVIPSTFRILRSILDRIEDSKTGEILVKELYVEIPEDQMQFAKDTVEILGQEIVEAYPFIEGAKPVSDNLLELYLNRAWRPTLCYTGIGDIPSLQAAGNVLRPKTSINLSFRLPPTATAEDARNALKKIIEEDPPYGAKITFKADKFAKGFYSPPFEQYLLDSFKLASNKLWGKDPAYESCGGSIPFLSLMQDAFPNAQFAVSGLLGPGSNAHGPNESCDIDFMFNLIAAMSQIIVDHYPAKCKKD